jgi:hypothetical protein
MAEEVLDLGAGVLFAVCLEDARPAGSTGRIQSRAAFIYEWVEGLIARLALYLDVYEVGAVVQRLAEQRGGPCRRIA